MKLKIIIITTVLIVIISCISTILLNTNKKDIDYHVKKIVENAKVIDANIDHNQALDVIEYAQKQGLETPSILINFDTHSDIYLNRKIYPSKGPQIEDWIDEYIAKNKNVDTIYWVMPKEEALDLKLRLDFGEHKSSYLTWGIPLYGNSLKPNTIEFLILPLTIKSYTQSILLEEETGILNEYAKGYEYNHLLFEKDKNYRKIKVITCTESTLPDFKDKKVFLSVDADYISNSGFDTVNDFKIERNPQQMKKALYSLVKTIDKKHIRPEIISLTISPDYLPVEHEPEMIDFYERFLIMANLPDALLTYVNYNKHEDGEEGKRFTKRTMSKPEPNP